MSQTTSTAIGTYLPPWGTAAKRTVGLDEDALTMAVAAGRGAIAAVDPSEVRRVVFVTRDFPLIVGGNAAALLGGLGVADSVEVDEKLGGAVTTLDAIAAAIPGSLIIGTDVAGAAGAAAMWIDNAGAGIEVQSRVNRSLPVTSRDSFGHAGDYADPRLLRESGVGSSLGQLGVDRKVAAVCGMGAKDAASLSVEPMALPTLGASSTIFALAALAEQHRCGEVVAVDQAAVILASVMSTSTTVVRDERPAQPVVKGERTPGSDISISLAAYDRAFDQKLQLLGSRCTTCATLAFPQRFRCLGCGSEEDPELFSLPREATVYSEVTIRVPVPGLISPYSLALAELGETGVRTLVHLTGAPAGTISIGDTGTLVLRRVAIRAGIPDYGYGFLPTHVSNDVTGAN